MNPVPAVKVGGNERREHGRDRVDVARRNHMDLYREFRKTIRPLTIPDNDEDRNTQENFTTRNRPPREKETRKEEMREKARSIAACEA